MGTANIMFVYPHNIVGDIVDIVEGIGDDPCHVAVLACGGLLEAVAPAVRISEDVSIYDHCRTEIISVEVPDLAAGDAVGLSLVGKPYGLYTSCVSGMIHELTGLHLTFNKQSLNCSEVGTLYLLGCGLNVLPEDPASCVTPRILRVALLAINK